MKVLFAALGMVAVVIFTDVVCADQPDTDRQQLNPSDAFVRIADQKDRSLALFKEAAKIITNPRCMNCHLAGDSPTRERTLTSICHSSCGEPMGTAPSA